MNQVNQVNHVKRSVTTRADLEKEIEKEVAFLMREGMSRDNAHKEARKFIQEVKYVEVAQKLTEQSK